MTALNSRSGFDRKASESNQKLAALLTISLGPSNDTPPDLAALDAALLSLTKSLEDLASLLSVDLSALAERELARLPKSWANAKPHTFAATANAHFAEMMLAHAQALVAENVTWRLGLTAAYLSHVKQAARPNPPAEPDPEKEAQNMPDLSSALEEARRKERSKTLEEAAKLLEEMGGAVIAAEAAEKVREMGDKQKMPEQIVA